MTSSSKNRKLIEFYLTLRFPCSCVVTHTVVELGIHSHAGAWEPRRRTYSGCPSLL